LRHFTPLRTHLRGAASITLLLLTLLAAAVRFYALDRQSLWFDEVCSWHSASYNSLSGLWQGDRAWNMYPPGYDFALKCAMLVFGDSEWALRLPSALAGTLSVPLIYILGTRLFSHREGLLTAVFLALSIFPIYFSQEARPSAALLPPAFVLRMDLALRRVEFSRQIAAMGARHRHRFVRGLRVPPLFWPDVYCPAGSRDPRIARAETPSARNRYCLLRRDRNLLSSMAAELSMAFQKSGQRSTKSQTGFKYRGIVL